MTDQQGTPDQLPADKGQGGAGASYKVPFLLMSIQMYLQCRRAQYNVIDSIHKLMMK